VRVSFVRSGLTISTSTAVQADRTRPSAVTISDANRRVGFLLVPVFLGRFLLDGNLIPWRQRYGVTRLAYSIGCDARYRP